MTYSKGLIRNLKGSLNNFIHKQNAKNKIKMLRGNTVLQDLGGGKMLFLAGNSEGKSFESSLKKHILCRV